MAQEGTLVTLAEAKRFMKDCLVAAGASEENAEIVAQNLASGDFRGQRSHGMNRLERFVNELKEGGCDGKAQPVVIKESASTAVMDGKNTFGAVAGKMGMDKAIQMAKATGIGFVAVKGSNNFGMGGIFAEQARAEGMIGMSFTNTSPLMCPTRAKEAALGTNPLACSAPAKDGDGFALDIATTAVAVGKLEMKKRANEQLPDGWALNEKGEIEHDPTAALAAKRLMPLGGTEENSGYKGFGLAMMVEVLSGILAGASYGPKARKYGDTSRPADIGHGFMALNPEYFAPGFQERMSDLMDSIRKLEPADPKKPVMVPGDWERGNMKNVCNNGGVTYIADQMETCKKLAEALKVQPLQPSAC